MMYKILLPVLLLAIGAYASVSGGETQFDLSTYLERHERKMQLMLSTFKSRSSRNRAGINELAGELSDEDIETCFDYYFDLEREISSTYNRNYRACILTADQAKQQITQESASIREDLLNRGREVCTDLEDCSSNTDILAFLVCYAREADDNINTLFKISNDADGEATEITARYQRIELDRDICVKDVQRVYVTDMAGCDDGLRSCLRGDSTVPSPTESTAAPPATTQGPEEPEETTEGLPEEDRLRLMKMLRMP